MAEIATTEPTTIHTAEEWRQWLSEQTNRFLRGYENDPDRLRSDKGGERSASRDYHGREILELLQNANDAAAEKGDKSKVRIELSEAGLVVANTGALFQPGGVKSLMLANLSPKPRNSLVIGNKGLGFRAVLNWTNQPIILSGSLRLGFAPAFARIQESRIKHVLEFLPDNDAIRLPVLQFPTFLDTPPDGAPNGWHVVYRACEACRESYDTAIGLPFERDDSFAEASLQIAALGQEVLLFVKHLDSIEIVAPNSPNRTWQIEREGNEAIVSENNGNLKSWTVWSEDGEIPLENISPDGPSRYEVAIAIPEQPHSHRKLFSHFETQVEFAYPVVCHASFELDQARNHIIQGSLNEFVLEKLAALHSRVVEEVAEKSKDWKGGKLAITEGQPAELFPRGDYHALLIRNLKGRKFLPCVDGMLRRPDKARFANQGSPSWLPPIFGDVVNLDAFSNAASLLTALEVPTLGEQEWRDRIENLDYTNVEQVATFAAGLIRSDTIRIFKSNPPHLLIDSRGERTTGGRIYVSGSKERGSVPPGWLSIRFLHSGLRERLQELLGESDVRDLAARLKLHGFDAEEYNTVSVSGAAATQAENYIAANPGTENPVRHELLSFLYHLFLSVRGSETEFRHIARLQVPNLANGWTPATSAHFSDSYGDHGKILHALYAGSRPDLLVASTETFTWAEDKAVLAEFLKWIGVHSLPKEIKADVEDRNFIDYVKTHIPESFRVTRGEFYTRNDIQWRGNVEAVNVMGLSDVLANATPEAILAWVSKDGRWGKWPEPSREHGSFRFVPHGCSAERTYDGPIPSYPYWLIQRNAWLIGDDGHKHAPNQMLLSEDSRISGIIAKPAVRASEALTDESILSALYRVGLSPNITTLHPSAFYAALKKCEVMGFKAGNSFYRFIIEERKAGGDGALLESSERSTFVREGRLWADFEGAVRLIPVEKCRYRRGDDIPKGISQYVPLVTLPVKRGPDRVENLFAVKPLKDSGYQIRNSVERDGNAIIQLQLLNSVEAILMLRQSTGRVDRAQHDALNNLQLHICSEVTAIFVGEDVAREVQMANNEWVLTNGNRELYILCLDGNDLSLKNESLVNAIVEAIASIFGLADASQFARLIQAADDNQRLALLSSLMGEAPEQVQEQLAQWRVRIEQQSRAGGFAIPQPPPPPEEWEKIPGKKEADGEQTEENKTDGPCFESKNKIKVDPLEHTPVRPRKIAFRVSRKSSDDKKLVLRHGSRANGEEAERIAEAFERSEGRFPVRVDAVQGRDGAGCDILSFDTEAQAEAVRSGVEKNPFDTASRMIEVKGRKDQTATIALDGYECAAAHKRAARYFLYRVYADEEAGTWQIAVLQNPAQTYSAHIDTLVLSLEQTDATKKYLISVEEDRTEVALN